MAPSPTGALHLGNARTFLINWALARQNDWLVRMRLDDLDGPRIKPEAAQGALDVLTWLGLDWDEEILTQSDDLEPYGNAIHHLAEQGLIFPCSLTRKEIELAASAPHGVEHDLPFPRHLRPAEIPTVFEYENTNWRFVVEDRDVAFVDCVCGPQKLNPSRTIGDFVVWTKQGQPAYQLAVVVDDLRQEVTEVVRGDDLLRSAARQMLLYEALGHADQIPRYTHLPLVLGSDGRRLAKRHGDTRVDTYRRSGVSAERIIGLMAHWSGVLSVLEPMTARAFAEAFQLDRLPSGPVMFTRENEQWLNAECE